MSKLTNCNICGNLLPTHKVWCEPTFKARLIDKIGFVVISIMPECTRRRVYSWKNRRAGFALIRQLAIRCGEEETGEMLITRLMEIYRERIMAMSG